MKNVLRKARFENVLFTIIYSIQLDHFPDLPVQARPCILVSVHLA